MAVRNRRQPRPCQQDRHRSEILGVTLRALIKRADGSDSATLTEDGEFHRTARLPEKSTVKLRWHHPADHRAQRLVNLLTPWRQAGFTLGAVEGAAYFTGLLCRR